MLIERIVDNKRFKVEIDFKEIKSHIAEAAEEYSDHPGGDIELPLANYHPQCAEALAIINAIEENNDLAIELIINTAKKKNGWFRKGAVYYHRTYGDLSYESQDEYGSRTYAFRCKAHDDDLIELTFETYVEKW